MWYSLHGFIHDFNALDKYLSHTFTNFINNNKYRIKAFFFIRYWLGGPHIRFRFKCTEGDYEELKFLFEKTIQDFLAENEVQKMDYSNFYKPEMLENEDIKEVYWCEHGSVLEFPYIPEYERYGGVDYINLSEIVFVESSKLSCLINSLSYWKRIVASLDLIFLSFKYLGYKDDAYQQYSKLWEVYASKEDISNLMQKYKPILEKRMAALQNFDFEKKSVYSAYLTTMKSNLREINNFYLIASHVHMTNNRIGVHPEFEFEISTIISHKLNEGE
ncbi:lantibiotic dehydratase C-terminal domain-containing protein [Paenibacillus sp. TSA_86.1]|uniref:lantibiotic dehydratase C-terminal domain-containing protein n=1 Tax=Paenibacillus sp. TSA_86.1 TaxID=3415649 RepID=UPI0040457A63